LTKDQSWEEEDDLQLRDDSDVVEMEQDKLQEDLEVLQYALETVLACVKETRTYPRGHRHLKEIPDPNLRNFSAWMKHAEALKRLKNGRRMRNTFSPERRGHMFSQI